MYRIAIVTDTDRSLDAGLSRRLMMRQALSYQGEILSAALVGTASVVGRQEG